MDNCFNANLKCQNVNCKRSAREHVLSFIHNDGRVDITVGWTKFDLAAAALASAGMWKTLTPLGLVVGWAGGRGSTGGAAKL